MKHYAAVVEVWVQCSADYNAVKKTEVIELDPTTTIGELMEHVGKWNLLGCGDVRIVESAQGTGKELEPPVIKKNAEFTSSELLMKMNEIIEEYPHQGNFADDGRYTYPDRWNALLKYIKEKQ